MIKVILFAVLVSTSLLACNPKVKSKDASITEQAMADATSDADYGSATFSVDGKSYTGKITKQIFTDKSYSDLCQQNEPFALLQITFKDEATAKKAGDFKPTEGFVLGVDADQVTIGISAGENVEGSSSGKGTVTVSGNTLLLKDISWANSVSKKSGTINVAEIKLP